MIELLLATILLQPPQAPPLPPPQAPATGEIPSQAPPLLPDPVPAIKPPTEQQAYNVALSRSRDECLPFIVFVNCYRRDVNGAVSAYRISYNASDAPRILVFLPGSQDGYPFPATATDAEIRTRWEVSRAAIPFDESWSPKPARPDADVQGPWVPSSEQERLRSMWPKGIDFPDGLRFYRKARASQRIAVTNDSPSLHWYDRDQDDNWANAPATINQNRYFPYAVSGGMHGLTGWRSYAAVVLPSRPRIAFGPIPIANGGLIPGYRWSYPDGTRFFDMLSKDDAVFELREREKDHGEWLSRVVYRDPEARPQGYYGKTEKSCLECHRDAGDSQFYGITIRGDDTIFSFLPSEIP